MIYGAFVLIFNLQSSRITSGWSGMLLAAILLALSFAITFSYLDHKEALFHQTMNGFQVCRLT